MKAKFFDFNLPADCKLTWKHVIDRMRAIPSNSESRAKALALYGLVRIDKIDQIEKTSKYLLNWVRIRNTKLPAIADRRGKLEPIQIEDDEGIGEETAMILDVSNGRVLIQASQFGLTGPAIGVALEKFAPETESIDVHPVVNTDSLQKVEKMPYVLAYSVSLGKIEEPSIVSKFNSSAEDTLELLDSGVEARLDVNIKLDRPTKNNPGIPGKTAAKWVRSILRQKADKSVEDIRVKGKVSDGKVEIIDILGYQRSGEVTVGVDKNRRLPLRARLEGLVQIWNRHSK